MFLTWHFSKVLCQCFQEALVQEPNVLSKHYVARFQHSYSIMFPDLNIPMFLDSNVSKALCSQIPMFPELHVSDFNIPRDLCFHIPVFPDSSVPQSPMYSSIDSYFLRLLHYWIPEFIKLKLLLDSCCTLSDQKPLCVTGFYVLGTFKTSPHYTLALTMTLGTLCKILT